jgi:hypothetical protein
MKSEVGVFKYRYMRRIAETTTFLQELKRLRDHMGRRIDTKALRIDYCEKLLGTSWSHAVSALPPGWMDNTIDHIIPIDCYDLNNETDLFKCFNFHNLQVLTLSENCAKGVSIVPKTEHMQALWPSKWNDTWIGTDHRLIWRPIVSI